MRNHNYVIYDVETIDYRLRLMLFRGSVNRPFMVWVSQPQCEA